MRIRFTPDEIESIIAGLKIIKEEYEDDCDIMILAARKNCLSLNWVKRLQRDKAFYQDHIEGLKIKVFKLKRE